MDDNHELRSQLIAALMTAEEMDYADAERVVGEYERDIVCPRCGAVVEGNAELVFPPNKITRQAGTWGATITRPVPPLEDESLLFGTIWAGNSR